MAFSAVFHAEQSKELLLFKLIYFLRWSELRLQIKKLICDVLYLLIDLLQRCNVMDFFPTQSQSHVVWESEGSYPQQNNLA